jgi:hypothetical protein
VGRQKNAYGFSRGNAHPITRQPFAERSAGFSIRFFCGSGERELKGQLLLLAILAFPLPASSVRSVFSVVAFAFDVTGN